MSGSLPDTRAFEVPDAGLAAGDDRALLLLRVLRIVIRADSDPARQALFRNLLQARPWLRLAFAVHERLRGTWASALLVGCFGLVSFLGIAPAGSRRTRILAVAQHENARRQVQRVFAWMGTRDCALVRTGAAALSRSGLAAFAVLLSPASVRRTLRIVRIVDRRHGFLVACRAAAAMAWYARSKSMLRAATPSAVLVSSDSNPEELGFVAAARALDIPQVFISHAYPTPLSPALDFSLSILEGEAAVRARQRKGPIRGRILLAGVEGESAPLDPRRVERVRPVIGIFTSKAVSWPTLATIVDDCRRHFRARKIVIRWHPSMLEQPRLGQVLGDLSGIVESPGSDPLADIARQCDWVIADENSNVHLPVLKLGIPTIAVRHLGVYPESRSDQYGFAAHGVVFPPVASVRDVRAQALIDFFLNGWHERFEQYDASYLRPAEAVSGEVRRAIEALFEPASAYPSIR